MKKRVLRFALYSLSMLGINALSAEPRHDSEFNERPTIVLVHGAFADSSSWSDVATRLVSHGYPVVAVANPLRGVERDAAYLSALIHSLKGAVVLVGHSYGGTVITNVSNPDHRIRALVYVAGFQPDRGETAAALSARFPGSTLGSALAEPVSLGESGDDLYIRQERFHAQFAADLPDAVGIAASVAQRPIAAKALSEPSGTPLWASVPSWAIYGSDDKNIPAAAFAFMAQRARTRRTIEIKGASHVVMMSHPDAVADLIMEAAR